MGRRHVQAHRSSSKTVRSVASAEQSQLINKTSEFKTGSPDKKLLEGHFNYQAKEGNSYQAESLNDLFYSRALNLIFEN